MNVDQLTHPLEELPITVLNCYKSLEIPFIFNVEQWSVLNQQVNTLYKKNNTEPTITAKQKFIWGNPKYRTKVPSYPVSFIPEIIELILLHYKAVKPKRKRINNMSVDE